MSGNAPLDPLSELWFLLKREFVLLTGKNVAVPVANALEKPVTSAVTSSPQVHTWLQGLSRATGTALSTTVTGMIFIGASAAIAGALSQMDYNHRRDVIKDVYKDEIASQLGKSKDKVTAADLDKLATVNSTIDEELRRSKKQRNFGIVVGFVATLAALAAPLLVAAALPGITLSIGTGVMATVTEAIAHMAIGVVAYKAVEGPLHAIADKMFGLDDRITNDYITDIERDREAGKVISREQVLAVFAAANKEVDRLIVSTYGKHFDELSAGDKQRAAAQLNQIIPLEKLTLDINVGRIDSSELAFAVEGKSSGVQHDPAHMEEERKGGIRGVLDDVGVKLNQSPVGQAVEKLAVRQLSKGEFVTPVEGRQEQHHMSFVERLGRGKRQPVQSYAEHIEQSRAEPSAALQQS